MNYCYTQGLLTYFITGKWFLTETIETTKQNISIEWVQSSFVAPSLYFQLLSGHILKVQCWDHIFSDNVSIVQKPFELIFFFWKPLDYVLQQNL